MDWARILAFVTGMVDQELLARNEYLAPMAGDTKSADRHWKPSADTFGILVFDNSPNQRAGIQMIGL